MRCGSGVEARRGRGGSGGGSEQYGVPTTKCGVRREYGVRSAECGVRSAECGVRQTRPSDASDFLPEKPTAFAQGLRTRGSSQQPRV